LNGFSRKFLFVFLFYYAFVQEPVLCMESRRRRGQTLKIIIPSFYPLFNSMISCMIHDTWI
jgi:hypothetical protein